MLSEVENFTFQHSTFFDWKTCRYPLPTILNPLKCSQMCKKNLERYVFVHVFPINVKLSHLGMQPCSCKKKETLPKQILVYRHTSIPTIRILLDGSFEILRENHLRLVVFIP